MVNDKMFNDRAIERFKERVYEHRLTQKDQKKILQNKLMAPADNPLYNIDIGPYHVCFTVEERRGSGGAKVFKHISICGPERGRLPNSVIVNKILAKFDFRANLRRSTGAHLYVENAPDGAQILNFMEAHLKSNRSA